MKNKARFSAGLIAGIILGAVAGATAVIGAAVAIIYASDRIDERAFVGRQRSETTPKRLSSYPLIYP